MEMIAICIGNGLAALVTVIVYVYLVASVYPCLTMRPVWKHHTMGDRGLRRVVFQEGRGVVCEPAPSVRRYMPSYALLWQNGYKYLRCRLDERVAYIRYDVVVFDRRGRVLEILSVSERPMAAGSTRPVRLPTATAYVCVVPRRVDGMYTGSVGAIGYSPRGMGLYAGLAVVSTVVASLILYQSLTAVTVLLHPAVAPTARWLVVASAIVLGVVCAACLLFLYHIHSRRVIER